MAEGTGGEIVAEFQIVARAYNRMCDSYSTCEDCPINEYGSDMAICRCRVLKWPCKYESKIMAWAAEHPEPVYPTLAQWLRSVGLANHRMIDPIPADIAQKLGIEPKEST